MPNYLLIQTVSAKGFFFNIALTVNRSSLVIRVNVTYWKCISLGVVYNENILTRFLLCQLNALGHLGSSSNRNISNAAATVGGGGPLPAAPNQLGVGSAVVRSEPISLGTLDRDCFVIPVHSVDRFLPAGIPVGFYRSRYYNYLQLSFQLPSLYLVTKSPAGRCKG